MTNLEIFYKILDFLPNETYFRTTSTKVSSMENEYDRELSSLTLQSNNFLFNLQEHATMVPLYRLWKRPISLEFLLKFCPCFDKIFVFIQGQAREIWTYHSSKFEIWPYHKGPTLQSRITQKWLELSLNCFHIMKIWDICGHLQLVWWL